MYMLHHYLQRGFKPEQIINLPYIDKLFYRASMDLAIEEEIEKARVAGGG